MMLESDRLLILIVENLSQAGDIIDSSGPVVEADSKKFTITVRMEPIICAF